MKTITTSEFRKNMKHWATVAETEKVLVNRGNGKAFAVVPIDIIDDEGYSPELIKDIKIAMEQFENGEYTEIKDPKDVWKSIE